MNYQITKGELDPDLFPDEPAILHGGREEDFERYNEKSDLKMRRSREVDRLSTENVKFKDHLLSKTHIKEASDTKNKSNSRSRQDSTEIVSSRDVLRRDKSLYQTIVSLHDDPIRAQ